MVPLSINFLNDTNINWYTIKLFKSPNYLWQVDINNYWPYYSHYLCFDFGNPRWSLIFSLLGINMDGVARKNLDINIDWLQIDVQQNFIEKKWRLWCWFWSCIYLWVDTQGIAVQVLYFVSFEPHRYYL